MNFEKMPRQYAIDILKLKTKEERVAYLENEVPDKYKDWVSDYVRTWWPRRLRILRGLSDKP